MATIILRSSKSIPLTDNEVDANFSNLNNELTTKLNTSDFNSTNVLSLINGGSSGELNATRLNGYIQTSTSTPNTIILRDSGGNFAGNLTGTFNGTVNITGGTISALTSPLPIASGGTSATDAVTARGNLGLVIGANVQAFHQNLTGLSNNATNGIIVKNGSGTYVSRTITGTGGVTITNGDGISGNIVINGGVSGNQSLNTTDDVRFNSIGVGQVPSGTTGTLTAIAIVETSSKKFKTDITKLDKEYLPIINQLEPVSFTWKTMQELGTDYGLIAEEVNKILPEAVSKNDFGDCVGIHYSKLSIYLIKCIQELSKEIEILKGNKDG